MVKRFGVSQSGLFHRAKLAQKLKMYDIVVTIMDSGKERMEDTGDLANEVEASVGLQVKRQRLKEEKREKSRKICVVLATPVLMACTLIFQLSAPFQGWFAFYIYALISWFLFFSICWLQVFVKLERRESLHIIDKIGIAYYCLFYTVVFCIAWWLATLLHSMVSLDYFFSLLFLFIVSFPYLYVLFLRIRQRRKKETRLIFVVKPVKLVADIDA